MRPPILAVDVDGVISLFGYDEAPPASEARLELIDRTYHGPAGRAPRQLPFRRGALSFMRWQLRRGVLAPLNGAPPGSPWWRAVNERLLRVVDAAVSRPDHGVKVAIVKDPEGHLIEVVQML